MTKHSESMWSGKETIPRSATKSKEEGGWWYGEEQKAAAPLAVSLPRRTLREVRPAHQWPIRLSPLVQFFHASQTICQWTTETTPGKPQSASRRRPFSHQAYIFVLLSVGRRNFVLLRVQLSKAHPVLVSSRFVRSMSGIL